MRERNCDFHEPLTPIGQFAHELERIVGQPQGIEVADSLVDHFALRAGRAPQVVAMAVAFADGHAEIFNYGQSAEKLVDLESARETSPRTLCLTRCGDVVATEENRPECGFSTPVIKLTKVVFPAPLGDQCAACAPFKRKINVPRDRQGAEITVQFLDLQRGGHDRFLSAR